jgi:hypothetical protein
METTLEPMAVAITVQPTVAPTVIDKTNDAPDLDKLLAEILNLKVEIDGYESLSKRYGKLALELAIKSGGKLLECQKEVECKHKRGWVKWVETNIEPAISYETVRRYIRLWKYNLSHETEIAECESIREAYHVAGIFGKPKEETPSGEPDIKIKDDDSETKKEPNTITPEKFKELFPDKYNGLLSIAQESMMEKLSNILNEEYRQGNDVLKWDVYNWTIKNGLPQSSDGKNLFIQSLQPLQGWIRLRNFSDITIGDEAMLKAHVLSFEIIKKIMTENNQQ